MLYVSQLLFSFRFSARLKLLQMQADRVLSVKGFCSEVCFRGACGDKLKSQKNKMLYNKKLGAP